MTRVHQPAMLPGRQVFYVWEVVNAIEFSHKKSNIFSFFNRNYQESVQWWWGRGLKYLFLRGESMAEQTRRASLGRVSKRTECLLVTVVLTGLVCLVLWPWPHNFSSFLPAHFDPPFHAWKLQVIVDKILHHHQLVPDTNTNIFYPYANEFYYDALLWPQGVLAALLTFFGSSPILTYNLTLLFFWSFSGLAFHLLLRELDLDPVSCLFGAAVFCLLPYRISYYVEFNMEMVFGLPLFFYCWLRFYKNPTVPAGICLGLSFWLQAISELYQAIILALIFPLFVLPFLPHLMRTQARSISFYLASCAGIATALGLCIPFLAPYYSLFSNGYTRKIGEMTKHSLEPLSYLGRSLTNLITFPQNRVQFGEMDVFPSFVILILLAGYAWYARTIAQGKKIPAGVTPVLALRWMRFIAWVLFMGLIVTLVRVPPSSTATSILSTVGNGCLVIAMLATLGLGLMQNDLSDRERFLRGLSIAALLCFILSFGPQLAVMTSHVTANNLIFLLVRKLFPLDGLRVVSRFSVLVMVFLSVLSAVACHTFRTKAKRLRWLPALVFLLFVAEVRAIPHPYEKVQLPLSPLLSSVVKQHPDKSVLVVPIGDRYEDARFMFGLTETDTLLINGWGGFIPQLQEEINRDLHTDLEHFYQTARAIWPEPLIVVNRPALFSHIMRTKTGSIPFAFRERFLARECTMLASEQKYSVYQLIDAPRSVVQAHRYIRADLLRQNRQYTFRAKSAERGPAAVQLIVSLNAKEVARVAVGGEWREYRIQLPPDLIAGKEYESLAVRTNDNVPWILGRNGFSPEESTGEGH